MKDYISLLKRWWFGIVIALLVVVAVALALSGKPRLREAVLVLSPHYDDAALSLGGLIAKGDTDITVVTFFTGTPDKPVTGDWDKRSGFKDSSEAMPARLAENRKALASRAKLVDLGYLDGQYRTAADDPDALVEEMTKDIQGLMVSLGTTTPIVVYGPSDFGAPVTNPDHKLVHDAYVAALSDFPNPNVSFRFYEDFPYIHNFNKSSVISIRAYLEKETGKFLVEKPATLGLADLREKLGMIRAYASQVKAFGTYPTDIVKEAEAYFSGRCSAAQLQRPCEMTYEVFVAR